MAFDLDDDELKATRRMNGSDKNVGSMKEDIKLVGNLIKEYRLYGDLDGIAINDMSVYINAIEHLIKAYKELEEKWDKDTHKLQNALDLANADKINNYIPVSLVEEKIKELNKAYEDSKDENGESEYYYPDYTIRVLEELLEKRK